MQTHKSGASHGGQLVRLKKAEGQVRGIVKMVEDERYCIDIITQLKAVRSALLNVEKQILTNHLGHCVKKAISTKDTNLADEMMQEINDLMKAVR